MDEFINQTYERRTFLSNVGSIIFRIYVPDKEFCSFDCMVNFIKEKNGNVHI